MAKILSSTGVAILALLACFNNCTGSLFGVQQLTIIAKSSAGGGGGGGGTEGYDGKPDFVSLKFLKGTLWGFAKDSVGNMYVNDLHTIVKLNASGKILWAKTAPENRIFLMYSTVDSQDCLMIAGWYNRAVLGADDAPLLLKIRPDGTVIRARTYINPSESGSFFGIDRGPNGSIIVGGYWNYNPRSTSSILKIDANGDIQWQRNFEDGPFEMIRTNPDTNTIYAAAGLDTWQSAMRMDMDGNVNWSLTTGWASVSGATITADGGLALMGSSPVIGPQTTDGTLPSASYQSSVTKLDPSGNLEWAAALGIQGMWSVAAHPDGRLTVTGDHPNGSIIGLSSKGLPLYGTHYSFAPYSTSFQTVLPVDGSLWIAGGRNIESEQMDALYRFTDSASGISCANCTPFSPVVTPVTPRFYSGPGLKDSVPFSEIKDVPAPLTDVPDALLQQ